jgi:threonine dehydrogenase-like Zn-dependent dehydrogenase
VAIVFGCGPVGLAVVAMLKARGVATVVASDFSPKRRELARSCGADVVVNPAENSPFEHPERHGFLDGLPGLLELGVGTREKLGSLPLPWWHVWRLAEKLGLQPKRPIVFECVGVPGMLQRLIDDAPLLSRIMVVGYCMEPDRIEPAMSNNKEVDLRFCMGYSPLEHRDALHLMADGTVQCAHLITGTVGLDGVATAFDALRDPERHAKILIDPASLARHP